MAQKCCGRDAVTRVRLAHALCETEEKGVKAASSGLDDRIVIDYSSMTVIAESQSKSGFSGVPNEIRTRVTAVKGRCPRPLDDGDFDY